MEYIKNNNIVVNNVNQVKELCVRFYIEYSADNDVGFNDYVLISFVWKMKSYYAIKLGGKHKEDLVWDLINRINDKC